MELEEIGIIRGADYEGAKRSLSASENEVVERELDAYSNIKYSEPMLQCEASHEVNIKKLDYGFIVTIGCQKVAVETKETLLKGLTKYYENPEKAQKDWFKSKEEFLK